MKSSMEMLVRILSLFLSLFNPCFFSKREMKYFVASKRTPDAIKCFISLCVGHPPSLEQLYDALVGDFIWKKYFSWWRNWRISSSKFDWTSGYFQWQSSINFLRFQSWVQWVFWGIAIEDPTWDEHSSFPVYLIKIILDYGNIW